MKNPKTKSARRKARSAPPHGSETVRVKLTFRCLEYHTIERDVPKAEFDKQRREGDVCSWLDEQYRDDHMPDADIATESFQLAEWETVKSPNAIGEARAGSDARPPRNHKLYNHMETPNHTAPPVASTALFGSSVLLRRGGHDTPAPGQFRYVLATYIGARGHQVRCRLEQDDPDACVGYCTKKGDVGWWGRSIMSLPNAQGDSQPPMKD